MRAVQQSNGADHQCFHSEREPGSSIGHVEEEPAQHGADEKRDHRHRALECADKVQMGERDGGQDGIARHVRCEHAGLQKTEGIDCAARNTERDGDGCVSHGLIRLR